MSLRPAPARARTRLVGYLVSAVVAALTIGVLGPLPQANAAAASLSYVGAASSAGFRTAHTLRIPARVAAGDTLVLFMTVAPGKGTIATPAGWRLLQQRNGATSRARVWTKQATSSDHGRVVTVRTGLKVKSALSIAAYRSSARKSVVTASAGVMSNPASKNLTAPRVRVSQAGSWVVNLWAGRANKLTRWTPAAGTSARTRTGGAAGKSRMTALVADSRRAVATGTAAAKVARTNLAVTGRQQFAVAISPGVMPTQANRAPVAAFTSICDSLTCTFDASGSTDPDANPLTYTWDFGGGATGTGMTPSHAYNTPGTKNVTLTVSDGSLDSSVSHTAEAVYDDVLPGHTSLVPETPRKDFPNITKANGNPGEINDIEVVGNRAYIVGTFATAANRASNTTSYNRTNIAAFDLATGLIDPDFAPTFTGPAGGWSVDAVEASPDGTRLYIAGNFNAVNGKPHKGVARLDPETGAPVETFKADTDARATELAVTDSTVYIGGRFVKVNTSTRKSLAAVNALTGAVDPEFVNDLSGGIGVNGGLTVQKLLVTHDGSKLVVIHTGRQINGQDRYGIGIIDTATKQLTGWRTRLWDDNLQFVGGIQRIISGSIAPSDDWFVVSSGSGGDRPPINDTVVAYDLSGGNDVQPRWISRAFDSVYSTAITEKAVYIGGHFAWNESPSSPDPWPGQADIGYGTGQGLSGYALGDNVVARDHLGALNPTDGRALEWNPGSNSTIGNTSMIATPRGLLTGGDATAQGGENVGSLAFFDFDNITAPNGVDTTITTPIAGRVLASGQQFTLQGTATAPTGVRKVFIEVQDRTTLKWLQADKTTWGSSANFEATVTPTGATTADWSVNLTVPGNIKMLVRARAQDTAQVNGSRAEDPTKAIKKMETFSLDDATPTLTYTAPAAGVVNNKTFTVSGNAGDDKGVTGISMTLRNAAGGYLQDDGTVDATYNSIGITPDVPGALNTTWSKEISVPTEGTWNAQALAHDTGGNATLDTVDRTWNVTENGMAPTVAISSPGSVVPPTAPQPVTVTPGQKQTFSGTATDDGTIKSVYVALLNNSTGENLTTDGTWGIDNGLNIYKLPAGNVTAPAAGESSYKWTWQTPQNLTPGNYTFAVLATDDDDITTPQASWALLTMNAQFTGNEPPKATLTTQGVQPPALTQAGMTLDLAGTATDDQGVSEVRLVLKDLDTSKYLHEDGTVGSYESIPVAVADAGATSTSWSKQIELPQQGNWNVTAYAVDAQGQRDLANTNATARYPVYPGDAAPTLTDDLLAPTENASFTDGRIYVSGRAEDTNPVQANAATNKVEVAIMNASNQYLSSSGTFGAESWRPAFLTSIGTPGTNFSYTTPVLPAGSYTVKVRATDQHGLVTTTPSVRHVTVSIPAGNAKPVAVLPAPVCGAGTDASNVCQFDARTSTDENASTLTYAWNFGNGTTGVGPNPKKTFTTPGTFTVTLVAKDEWGASSDPVTRQVTIAEPAGNQAPDAVINTPSCNGLTCNFSAVGTTDDTGDSISYAWNFDDSVNNTATGPATSHVFSAAGTYSVTLTATDGWGNATTITRDVTVAAP